MRMYSAGEAQPWESASSFLASSRHQLASAQNAAKFPFLISSHVLRHSCGYKLANDGQDTRAIQHYLGHRSIASTVRYTKLAPDRFKGLERLRRRR
jgi:site-specific recombinase XerD